MFVLCKFKIKIEINKNFLISNNHVLYYNKYLVLNLLLDVSLNVPNTTFRSLSCELFQVNVL